MSRPDFPLLDASPEPDSHGKPVLVFFDTEFTDLTNPELLSIGFTASEFEAELYIEIEGARSHPGCTDFVRQAVLPLFSRHNPETLDQESAADRIESWFDELRDGDRRRGILLASDSPVDWQLFTEIRVARPGEFSWAKQINVGGRIVQTMLVGGRQMAAFNEACEAYFRQHKERHHALVDARAIKAGYREARFL